jgi:adenylosuccinate synthase
MPSIAVAGLQWGDEGKGKLVTRLAGDSRYVVRYQGGANAGHTVYVNGQKLVLHHLPCGAVIPGAVCLLMPGMVLYPETFFAEVEAVRKLGITVEGRVRVSNRIQITTCYHRALDRLREAAAGNFQIGTTGRGIGTTYADKAMRLGLRAADLLDPESLRAIVEDSLAQKNPVIRGMGGEEFKTGPVVEELLELGAKLKPYLADTSVELADALACGDRVLFEGAQAAMLDIDQGTYPYVTSSCTMPGGIGAGCGVNVGNIDEVVGVVKAYCTRVGAGGFPTELKDEVGDRIRAAGGEYGSTTGRPRRCGWFDAHAVRVMSKLARVSNLCVTKLDVLRGIHPLRIATGYSNWTGPGLPASHGEFDRLVPKYMELPGFDEDFVGATKFEQLPKAARDVIAAIEKQAGVPVKYISTGPETNHIIVR